MTKHADPVVDDSKPTLMQQRSGPCPCCSPLPRNFNPYPVLSSESNDSAAFWSMFEAHWQDGTYSSRHWKERWENERSLDEPRLGTGIASPNRTPTPRGAFQLNIVAAEGREREELYLLYDNWVRGTRWSLMRDIENRQGLRSTVISRSMGRRPSNFEIASLGGAGGSGVESTDGNSSQSTSGGGNHTPLGRIPIRSHSFGAGPLREGGLDLKPTDRSLASQMEFDFMSLQFRKLRQFYDTNFAELFPRGLIGTSMAAVDFMLLGGALMQLPFFLDPDMKTASIAWFPGMKFQVDQIPRAFLTEFFGMLTVKAAFQMNIGTTEEQWRSVIITYFRDRNLSSLSLGERYVLKLFEQMVLNNLFTPFRSKESQIQLSCNIEQLRRFIEQKDLDFQDATKAESGSDQDLNTIPFDYQKGELVGRGGFGAVYRCINVNNGVFYALKELPWSGDRGKEKRIRLEIDTLKRLKHENIIKYYGCRFDREKKKVSILMEFASRNLRDMAVECHGLAKPLVLHYCRKILQGLAYLHDQGIIHRDIKAANILVTTSGEVKLSDFGSASLFSEAQSESREPEGTGSSDSADRARSNAPSTSPPPGSDVKESQSGSTPGNSSLATSAAGAVRSDRLPSNARALVGTPLFMAPEILQGSPPSEATDIWAFGCTLIELVSGKYPWQELLDDRLPMESIIYRIGSTTQPPALPPGFETSVSQDFKEFLYSCLCLDPAQRPTAEQLLLSPVLTTAGTPLFHHDRGNSSFSGCSTPTTPYPVPPSGIEICHGTERDGKGGSRTPSSSTPQGSPRMAPDQAPPRPFGFEDDSLWESCYRSIHRAAQ